MEEIWKDIAGYEGQYQVSNLGRVRSLDRVVESSYNGRLRHRKVKGKMLSPAKYNGYLYVGLSGELKSIHRLVAEAFIPNPDNLPVVNHNNGVKTNNYVENLEWCTSSENMKHAFDTGLNPKGSKHGMSKLTENDVKEIKRLLFKGMKQADIARMFNIGTKAIYNIKVGKTWVHVS